MQWKNVSFEERQFKLTHTLSRLKTFDSNAPVRTTLELRSMKTNNARRSIDLFDEMYEALLRHKRLQDELSKQHPGYNPGGFVFVTPDGRPVEPRTYEDFFRKVTEAAGIEGATFHTLRHTFATRGIESGMDILVLSKILGHANPETTLKLYGHILAEHKRSSMQKVGKLYSSLVGEPEVPEMEEEGPRMRM